MRALKSSRWSAPPAAAPEHDAPAPPEPARAPARPAPSGPSWRSALRVALVPWVAARLVVLGALAVAHELVERGRPLPAVAARVHEGLLGWDSGWYEAIARHGYGGAGHESLRFFPLVPLVVRGLSTLTRLPVGGTLLAVSNVSALVAVTVLVVLARRESGDDALARRAAWLACLAPPAFTAVMGYAEGTLLALGARAWWWAGLLGLLAGATRPLGVLLVVPAVVEVVRARRAAPATAAAVLGPAAGCGAFLGWVGWRYGDALAPLRVQQQGTLRGRVADPVRTLAHDASLLAHGRHLGSALHLPWVLLAVALVVVALARWPACYGALAAAVVAVAVTASNLDGFERYAWSAFPLVLAGASLTARPRVERLVLVLAAAGLALYSLLAFTNLYVP